MQWLLFMWRGLTLNFATADLLLGYFLSYPLQPMAVSAFLLFENLLEF